jgi:predicted amidohydrolase
LDEIESPKEDTTSPCRSKLLLKLRENAETFDASLLRIGIMICYDLYFPEIARILALGDADIVLVPSADWYP